MAAEKVGIVGYGVYIPIQRIKTELQPDVALVPGGAALGFSLTF